jgi:hypothetical protein
MKMETLLCYAACIAFLAVIWHKIILGVRWHFPDKMPRKVRKAILRVWQCAIVALLMGSAFVAGCSLAGWEHILFPIFDHINAYLAVYVSLATVILMGYNRTGEDYGRFQGL